MIKLTTSVSRKQQYIIFAVRDAAVQQPADGADRTTYQAYNVWGGKSLDVESTANRGDTGTRR